MADERDSGSILPQVFIAFAVLAVIGVCVFLFNPHRVADLTITKVETFAPKIEQKAPAPIGPDDGIRVLDQPPSAALSDLYIIVTPKLKDDLRLPLFLTGAVLTVTAPDGSQTEMHAIDAVDLPRLTAIFPQMVGQISHPLKATDEVGPGLSAEGQFVFQMPNADAAIWAHRKAADFTIELRNQEAQTVKLPQ